MLYDKPKSGSLRDRFVNDVLQDLRNESMKFEQVELKSKIKKQAEAGLI